MATLREGLLAMLLLVASAARGDASDEYPLRLAVGESVALCSTGTLLCPAAGTRCDDTSVVAVAGDDRGPVLTGVKEGTTMCSAGSASGLGLRRVYRVTVVGRDRRSP